MENITPEVVKFNRTIFCMQIDKANVGMIETFKSTVGDRPIRTLVLVPSLTT